MGEDGTCQELELTMPVNVQGHFPQEDSLMSLASSHRSQASGFMYHAFILKESAASSAEPHGQTA